MKADQHYCVALFDSVSHVMKAEKILKGAGIPHKLIPVPRSISSDCGVCLRFLPEQKEAVIEALESTIHISEMHELLL
ncbi:MAG: DUF3343 domain-containing protein [Proteobacteria bacterium]|nr:DUF3343 domain-containing protein [Pseudomonadota bacterium]